MATQDPGGGKQPPPGATQDPGGGKPSGAHQNPPGGPRRGPPGVIQPPRANKEGEPITESARPFPPRNGNPGGRYPPSTAGRGLVAPGGHLTSTNSGIPRGNPGRNSFRGGNSANGGFSAPANRNPPFGVENPSTALAENARTAGSTVYGTRHSPVSASCAFARGNSGSQPVPPARRNPASPLSSQITVPSARGNPAAVGNSQIGATARIRNPSDPLNSQISAPNTRGNSIAPQNCQISDPNSQTSALRRNPAVPLNSQVRRHPAAPLVSQVTAPSRRNPLASQTAGLTPKRNPSAPPPTSQNVRPGGISESRIDTANCQNAGEAVHRNSGDCVVTNQTVTDSNGSVAKEGNTERNVPRAGNTSSNVTRRGNTTSNLPRGVNTVPESRYQGWNFVSCSHCQELCQPASWLLIGCTIVNNQSEARSES